MRNALDWMMNCVPFIPLVIQFLANGQGKALEDSPNPCAPGSHVRYVHEDSPGFSLAQQLYE